MQRRNFIKTTFAAAATTLIGSSALASSYDKGVFKLNYAPHFGMFSNSAGTDLFDQLKFMNEVGFRALEDNEMMVRKPEIQSKIGETMAKLGMAMGVFVIDGGDNWKVSLTSGKQEFKDTFLKTCRQAVETAKRCNAKVMTVVPGYFERNLPIGIQTGHVIDILKQAAAIFEPHGLAMVLEPLSDNPDLFLRTSDQTYMICRAVGSPSCKILYDIYHMQRNEGNVTAMMDNCWNEVAYIQIGDNPGRREPTTGEINYKNIFKHLSDKGYKGILGMEHGNFKAGKDGEEALIKAYRAVDSF